MNFSENVKKFVPEIVAQKLSGRLGLQKVIKNIGWLFFDKIFRMGVGLIVGVWIARYLGPTQYGLWNYTIAFTSLFSAFVLLGLNSIVVRDIVNNISEQDTILGTAFVMKFFAAVVTLGVTTAAIFLMKKGDMLSLWLVFLSSAGFIFQAVDVIDFYFQAEVKSKNTVIARNVAFLLVSGFKILLILNKAALIWFAAAGVIEMALSAAFMLIAYKKNHMALRKWRFDKAIAKRLLHDSWPIILADMAIMVYMRIDQIMIGNYLGDRDVGIYAAALRISEIWYFIPAAIVSSLLPIIISTKKNDEALYYNRLQMLFSSLTFFAIIVGIFVTCFSTNVVHMLYGNSYSEAATVLVIQVWVGVFVSLLLSCGIWLTAENLQQYSFYRSIVGCGISVLSNIILIPIWGIKGSACSSVLAYGSMLISWVIFKKTRVVGIMMLRSLVLYPGIELLWKKVKR